MADSQNTGEMVFTLVPQAGIKRDGTAFGSQYCTDGQWVRFQRGKPKKIGGFRRITDALTGPVRKLLIWSRKDIHSVLSFSKGKIENLLIDANFTGNDIRDRTPAGFVSNNNNMWTADVQYDDAVGSQSTVILAHCSRSLTNIDDDTASKPYFALASSVSSLFAQITDAPAVSGGVFSLAPYTVLYGSDGYVAWSDANQPQVYAGSTNPGDAGADRVTGSKIVMGLPLRAGRLSALLWSLDSVLRMDYVGGSTIFNFSHVSTESSILAQHSVIEYDGVYFWIGVDRFMYYDSTVKELPNDLNQDYFFDNLNYAHRQKIWATKVPRYGEIWWFYPRGTATECSHAVIYNVRLKTWYDAQLGRSAGAYSKVLSKPIWAEEEQDVGSPGYEIYVHEMGKNVVVGDNETALRSYFTTQNFGQPHGGAAGGVQGDNGWTRLTRVEPDFVQTGAMTCTAVGQEFAQSTTMSETSFEFTSTTEKIDMRLQHRCLALRFESNILDGSYELGSTLVHVGPGDNRS